MYKAIVSLLLLLTCNFEIIADTEWDAVRFHNLAQDARYKISMGTGFYINHDTIVTNAHVVSNCINIAIRGAVKPQQAELYTVDPELDLALLKTVASDVKVPFLRNNYVKLTEGDILFSVGYPLDLAASGKYIVKEAKVLKILINSKTKLSKIEFTDNVSNGNSGGPLLDKNSNIVGVVTAKHWYYLPENPEVTTRAVAVAISAEGLQKFLRLHNVAYASSSTYDMVANYTANAQAKNYLVNIHCIQHVE